MSDYDDSITTEGLLNLIERRMTTLTRALDDLGNESSEAQGRLARIDAMASRALTQLSGIEYLLGELRKHATDQGR